MTRLRLAPSAPKKGESSYRELRDKQQRFRDNIEAIRAGKHLVVFEVDRAALSEARGYVDLVSGQDTVQTLLERTCRRLRVPRTKKLFLVTWTKDDGVLDVALHRTVNELVRYYASTDDSCLTFWCTDRPAGRLAGNKCAWCECTLQ